MFIEWLNKLLYHVEVKQNHSGANAVISFIQIQLVNHLSFI